MKTSTILQRAKKHLGYRSFDGVCLAVSCVPNIRDSDCGRVEVMIQDRISPFTYAHRWLAYTVVHGKPARPTANITASQYAKISDWIRTQTDSDLRAWRLRWMDSMIAEFKAKGD